MAVLVAQDHPDTLRRTPASGDGGIDLMIPGTDGYAVQQVKRFTGRLGGSERTQIADSYSTIRADPRLDHEIVSYAVVVPIDLTPDEQKWWDGIIKDAPWPTAWLGETHWHALSSRHPHVVDYFFGGGRDAVAKRAIALQAGVVDPSRPLDANDVAGRFDILRSALNREDPHYQYDLSTSPEPPSRDSVGECALVQSRQLPDGSFLSIIVRPKHKYSLRDAPIRGSLTIDLTDPGIAEAYREKLREFHHFGRALDLPEGLVRVQIQAPGGLGGSFSGAGAWIGPAPSEPQQHEWRLVIVDAGGNELDLVVTIAESTAGPGGGAFVKLVDAHSCLELELRFPPPEVPADGVTVSLSLGDLTQRPVLEVLSVVRFVRALEVGGTLQIKNLYGRASIAHAQVERSADELISQSVLWHLEDLALLQERAAGAVLVPDEIDPAFAGELHEYARMLRGEVITGTWDSVVVNLHGTREDLGNPEPQVVAMEQDMQIDFGGQVIELGPFVTILAKGVASSEQPDDQSQLRLVPVDDATFTRRAGPLLPPEPPTQGAGL